MLLVGSILFNLGYSTVKKLEINMELVGMSYLIQTLNTAKKLSKINHPLQSEINETMKPFKSVLRFSFAFQSNDSSGINILLDYLNMLFMLPFIAYHYVFNRIKDHEKEAIRILGLLGDLEVAYAVLNYRKTLPLHTKPKFVKEQDVIAADVYHPLLDSPVVNPVKWSENTLVTGSNASGKSTYVKSVAINCSLAQTINTCLASEFQLERGHVLTSMAVEDDVIMGDSYFVAEIKSLKRVLNKIKTKDKCYLFIDEILRGTNTVERIAASSSIIHWINDYPSLAFVATHDIELTEILKDQVANVHFKETVTDEDGIQFDYLLRSGPATSRNAILLLQTMDFPSNIVTDAKVQAKHFGETQDWLHFNSINNLSLDEVK
jgi:DNA mismatch repair ATPase MutS